MGATSDGGQTSLYITIIAGGFVLFLLVLLVPFMMFGGASSVAPPAAEDNCGAVQPAASDKAQEIPANYLALYKRAGQEYGIPWNVLAGIGEVETSHGQSKLPGVSSGENYAGAGGPMQFIKSTWASYGIDGNRDGKKSRYDPADAIPGAANYLKASGAPGNMRKAIWAYNHLKSYVDLVLSWSKKYASSAIAAPQSTCVAGQPEAASNPPPGVFVRRSPRVGVAGCASVTQAVINEADTSFGPYVTIGCMRPGDRQDHGTGHAADLMLSSGGRMPGPSGVALGDRTANWAIANYKRLRVKYIIWHQRIWNPSICKCWRHMGDRGSITQNHFDHVHISVLG